MARLLADTTLGEDVTDEDALAALGDHVERVWWSERERYERWPRGRTTDGSIVHICYRLGPALLETAGVTYIDFDGSVFPFLARLGVSDQGRIRTTLFVGMDREGRLSLHDDKPIIVAATAGPGRPGSIEIITGRRQTVVDWEAALEHEAARS